jgi:phosphatidylglycerophosphatase A
MIWRPTLGFTFSHPAHCIALGFGTGLSPYAPGTAGTLLAFPVFFVLRAALGPFDSVPAALEFIGVVGVLFAIGVWACERTGRDLGIPDHGGMNWDEVVAMLLILLVTPEHWMWWGLAFVAFRFFDVVKPPPIRYVDRNVKGGLGVMFDDIVAAFYTLLVLALVKRIVD